MTHITQIVKAAVRLKVHGDTRSHHMSNRGLNVPTLHGCRTEAVKPYQRGPEHVNIPRYLCLIKPLPGGGIPHEISCLTWSFPRGPCPRRSASVGSAPPAARTEPPILTQAGVSSPLTGVSTSGTNSSTHPVVEVTNCEKCFIGAWGGGGGIDWYSPYSRQENGFQHN